LFPTDFYYSDGIGFLDAKENSILIKGEKFLDYLKTVAASIPETISWFLNT